MKKRYLTLFISALLLFVALAGCAGLPDGKKLVRDSLTNLGDATGLSMTTTVKGFLSDEEIPGLPSHIQEMEMSITVSAYGILLEGTIHTEDAQKSEKMYFLPDDAITRVYLHSSDGNWYTSILESDDSLGSLTSSLSDTSSYVAIGTMLHNMAAQMQTQGIVQQDGVECYDVLMTMDLEKLMESTGQSGQVPDNVDVNLQWHTYIEKSTTRMRSFSVSLADLFGPQANENKDLQMAFLFHYDDLNYTLPGEAANAIQVDSTDQMFETYSHVLRYVMDGTEQQTPGFF